MSLREQLQQTLGTAYTLERELGGGGMSRVFVAEESALARKVVIKVLPPEIAAGVSVERFKREIQLAARLQHPHIVPVLSSGEMEGVPYYTMPFVEGENVRARLARSGALSITEAIGILRDVAKALAYAHERGIVHRDIKPDNVLLSGGSATVADFGIAKAIAAARGDEHAQPTLTSIGSALGTPAYMAPEQAAADPSTNHRADIYAFGCMAYEMLTGRPPFTAKTPQRLLAAQMSDTPEPITMLRGDIPADLAELIMRCLAKEADARPQQAADLVRVLDTVTSGSGHHAMPQVLMGGQGMLGKALAAYAAAFVFVAILARAAIIAIGLPSWVFPGALIVMALGLPVILFTAYAHRAARKAVTQTPTYTPGGTPSAAHGTMATLALKAGPHLSWRRTWLGGALAVGGFVLLVAGYMTLRALGIGPAGSLLAAGTLGANERLLIADFNSTAVDSTLGPVVTEAFRTALSQSRALTLVQPNEVRETLRRMQRAATTRLDFSVAREVASREGLKAVLMGGVQEIGGRYVLSAELQSPQTGEVLATFRETAANESELLPAIDKLAKSVRSKAGESLKAVQAALPLERVTTPSLEALKKYVQGNRIMSYEQDWSRGMALLEEAVQLDTAFAMAYRRLAVEYSNRGQPDKGEVLLEKAFRHRERLSDAERYLVMATYYARGAKQDLARSTAAYEALIELQPDYVTAHNNVAINYRWQRDWAKAEQSLRKAISLGQAPVVTYNQLIWSLWNQGKTDEAWATLSRYDSLFPNVTQRLARRSELLFGERKFDSAAAVMDRARRMTTSDPNTRALATGALSRVARTVGRLRETERLSNESVQLNVQRGSLEAPLIHAADLAATRAYFLNDRAGAIAALDQALQKTPLESLHASVRPWIPLAWAYAVTAQPDRAKELLASFERSRRERVETFDVVNRNVILGAIAYGERRYDDAARAFTASDVGDCPSCSLPWIADAYDLAGKTDSALAFYERYVNTPDAYRWEADQWTLAPAEKRLGELYEARGDRQNALKHYLQFVEIWKNADPELQPKVAEVRRRIARLRDTEGR